MAEGAAGAGRTTRRRYLRAGGAAALCSVAGCVGASLSAPIAGDSPVGPYDVSVAHDPTAWRGYDPDWTAPTAPPAGGYTAETLVENLEIPWDLSFAPSGELFLSERTGRVLRLATDGVRTVAEPADAVDAAAIAPGSDARPWRVEGGEGGLLGVAAHPTYPEPPLVYAYYTAVSDDGRRNRVVAFDASRGADGGPWPIVDDIPADTFHNGGRLTFGPANHLWVTTGDADPGMEAVDRTRDPGSLAGKVLRVTPAGDPPADGRNAKRGDPRVYTYGHRNPQGIAWLPDGTPLIAEHGPGAGDEVNVLRAGGDYGWPAVRHGDGFGSYAGTRYVPPVASAPVWAPAGSVFYTGAELPDLRNRLLFGGLVSQRVVALTLSDGALGAGYDRYYAGEGFDDAYRAASTPLFADEFGRIRHLEQGPDGGLYALTSNRDGRAGKGFPTERDDRLLRIRPG